MKHFSITIRGRVQGVFFRTSAKEKARQLGVRGFVRNEDDGSVYMEAEGEKDALMQFISWCRKGPTRAIVSEVHVEESPINNSSSFRIDR